MGLSDSTGKFTIGYASVCIQPCVTRRETATFHDVQPYDVLEVPLQSGAISGLKAFGRKRRLGPKRCRADQMAGLIQVRRPPASGVVRLEWIRHAPMVHLGQTIASMTTTTTYKERTHG